MPAKRVTKVELGQVSGFSMEDAYFIALRYWHPGGFDPTESESWICRGSPRPHQHGGAGWKTGVWQSRSGQVFVSTSEGYIFRNPDPVGGGIWDYERVPFSLSGVWGLSDDNVFVWGLTAEAPAMAHFNGQRWTAIDAPSKESLVGGMHGISRSMIYAVGGQGLIARWNSSEGWDVMKSPVDEMLTGVWIESENEMYATGECILHGSIHGWVEGIPGETQLTAVAKWRGKVYVAATEAGLACLESDSLSVVKANVKAQYLDARGDLLVSSPEWVVGSKDGRDFTGVPATVVAPALDRVRPMP